MRQSINPVLAAAPMRSARGTRAAAAPAARAARGARLPALAWLLSAVGLSAAGAVRAEDAGAGPPPETGVEATAYYYALRDQTDFASGVVSYERGSLHLEGRYNYEDRNSGSAFVGWKFGGGDELSFEATPIVGLLFGAVRGLVPGLEGSVAYGAFDASVEAEYVHDLGQHGASYFYTWDELGWSPKAWLRLGIAGQRTRTVESTRSLERGLFAGLSAGKAHFSVYVFNPDLSSRYVVASAGVSF